MPSPNKGKRWGKPFEKGRPRTGGRAKGTPNKVTRDIKQMLSLLAQNMTPELEGFIKRTAKTDPAKAAQLIFTGIEFVQPRLQRTEMTGLDGSSMSVTLNEKDAKL